MTVVYCVQDTNGLIKIGYTKNFKKRVSSPEIGGKKVKRLGFFKGGFRQETQLHHNFQEHRVVGEWFKPAQEILDYIEKYASATPEEAEASDYEIPIDDNLFGRMLPPGWSTYRPLPIPIKRDNKD